MVKKLGVKVQLQWGARSLLVYPFSLFFSLARGSSGVAGYVRINWRILCGWGKCPRIRCAYK